jgi:hypothetical protein
MGSKAEKTIAAMELVSGILILGENGKSPCLFLLFSI